ncbi:amino acid ABC transporter permease/ATP-binding protein [Actinomadura viridis]|uniref:Polar amino acid transport system permease protein n=1 Tax=Actinomadura viridis TaxID=58110 RepID=A0A931DFS0_9ACTN|nr:amino acid ABC transporter permease/ATP-binding protein [Actinomadura viridis]MBG6089275.1 polar amino acid transport system permease protein [Actinomadura viridis]
MQFDWSYAIGLFADGGVWRAAAATLLLATVSWVLAGILGLGVALVKQSGFRVSSRTGGVYVWFFRGVPLLLLIIFIYNAVPQAIPASRGFLSNPFNAGLVALTLSGSAYMAEVFRSGLKAVGPEQRDAGRALGFGSRALQRFVIVPQAFRIAIPGLGNEYVSNLKNTSLVSVISFVELTLAGQRIYSLNFRILETLTVIGIVYLAMVTLFSTLQNQLEARLDVWRPRKSRRARAAAEAPVAPVAPAAAEAGRAGAETAPATVPAPRPAAPPLGPVVLEARQVSKNLGGREILRKVDFAVRRGEVCVLIGPSGSGKSTLLRCLNRLLTIDAGTVLLDDEPFGYRAGATGPRPEPERRVADQRRRVGMVFQRFELFPHYTVLDNVTLAPRHFGSVSRAQAREYGLRLLAKVGMETHADKYPHQLSGGQQQRVAIARTLALEPEVILFDEPTSALDPELVNEVLNVIAALAAEGMTMIIVSHEMGFARRVAHRVVFMDEGSILEEGSPQQMFTAPTHSRTRQFLAAISHGD